MNDETGGEDLRGQILQFTRAFEGRRDAPSLKGGGGGGTSDGMDARVARLESDMEHVKRTLGSLEVRASGLQKDATDLKVSAAEIKGDVKHLPGKGFIFSVCLGLLAATGGLTALIVRFLSP